MKRHMRRPGPLSERIARRLEQEGVLDVGLYPITDLYIDRTYAGREQRSQGAWSWELASIAGPGPMIGSYYPAREVAAWPEWDLSWTPGGIAIYRHEPIHSGPEEDRA
jgi:hypothetical protein